MEKKFEKKNFGARVSNMLKADARRMFTTPFLYIVLGIVFLAAAVILIMTTMMDGTVSVDPQTGKETVTEGFDFVWQAIGSLSSADAGMTLDLVGMCNINLVFFGAVVLTCIFISADFKSGYAKNVFTVHAAKSEYVVSKTVVCSAAAMLMVIAFFLGAVIGGGVSGLSFAMDGFNAVELAMCVLSKVCLMPAFVAIYSLMAIIAKQRTWLSMLLCFGLGMFMFAMIPMLTPLDATPLHPIFCLIGSVGLCFGMGAISRLLLVKRDVL